MTSSAQTAVPTDSRLHPSPLTLPVVPALNGRLLVGLLGVLLAVLLAGFNEHVTEIGLNDIRGQMGIGHDEGTWVIALFEACNISAMAFAPWFAVTFSVRRLTIAMTATVGILGALAPFMPDLACLLILRCVQGFASGALPPMLMTVALRFLPPPIKIYGLGAYALTATFGPNLATPLTGFWFEYVGWQFLFWQIVPLCVVTIICVAWGLPQDPMRLERFRRFDWFGLMTGLPGICCLVIALQQGDRLDWFRSPVITHLTCVGVFLFAVFIVNEWHHSLPFFRIQLLKQRNIADALLTLFGVLVLSVVTVSVPSHYLTAVKSYRPIQTTPFSLLIAIPQLLALPLVAAICNIRRIDCRHVLMAGLGLMGLSYWLGTWICADWVRDNFYPIALLTVFAQPMVIIPVLMLATMGLGPTDGPFISGMVNMTKGMASAVAAGLLDALFRRREQYHSSMLLDHMGHIQFSLPPFDAVRQSLFDPHLVDPGSVNSAAMSLFHREVGMQSLILACADIYVVMIGVCTLLIGLNLVLPSRVYPPRAAAPLSRQS
ncbi:Inner membrane component of tripartite multidrug resistance system [Acetobacter malorum]|uniref:MFS transporter n=1 Tax=Komagataeibacter swingsii TaxID=215220 RepID=A0A850P032_9PROT|nr:MFS transporter [Komagataeibacter swingsii]KFL91500.1 Inner membrane component of tripartite multidrug resistance system [Acetobacter malorum]NVN38025.1 MFS transporter [Komagataeibacter swingsii]